MLLEILLALSIGIFFGTLTGLIPGIHINLVAAFIVASSVTFFSGINSIYLIVFIVSLSITHTFIDFIPSVFLGAPDSDTELSVLPGHELLKEGLGHHAVSLSSYGGIGAIIGVIILALPSVILIKEIYPFIEKVIPYLLIVISSLLIFSEKNKVSALIVFSLSGLLGYSVLNMNLKEPLLPLLSGLFGASTLLISIKNKTKIPKQKSEKIFTQKKEIIKPLLSAVVVSPFCSFLPGLGSGQAAIMGNSISKSDRRGFLILVGATNTLVMGFSFISLYTISRTRTGSAVAIKELIGNPTTSTLILILVTVLISGIIAFYLTNILSRKISDKIEKINYFATSTIVIFILSILILIFSGIQGIIVFCAATAMGIYGINLKVRRTNLMGCLLIPTIIFYLLL